MKSRIRGMVVAATIAAIYTVLTIMPGLSLISFGALQFRISETLCVLPVFTPWAIPGLTIGCFVSNLIGAGNAADMLFGTFATLAAALCTYLLRRMPKCVALIPPVVFNGVIVGWMITFFYMGEADRSSQVLLMNMITVAAGEAGVCYLLGIPLAKYIENNKIFRKCNIQKM